MRRSSSAAVSSTRSATSRRTGSLSRALAEGRSSTGRGGWREGGSSRTGAGLAGPGAAESTGGPDLPTEGEADEGRTGGGGVEGTALSGAGASAREALPPHLDEPVQTREHEERLVDQRVAVRAHLLGHLFKRLPQVVGDSNLASGAGVLVNHRVDSKSLRGGKR